MLVLVVHSFLKLSKTDISEDLRFLARAPTRLLRSTTKNRQGQDAEQEA